MGTKFVFECDEDASVVEIPNNKTKFDQDRQADKTFDNGIVNIRFTQFYQTVIDNVHAIMVESQIKDILMKQSAEFTYYEKNCLLRSSIKTAMNMLQFHFDPHEYLSVTDGEQ